MEEQMINSIQKKKLVGYDLDGVITDNSPKRDKPFIKQNSEERKAYSRLRMDHCLNGKLMFKPEGDFIIATARKKDDERAVTLLWLKKHNINPINVYFLEEAKTRENIIKFKAQIINQLNLAEFSDDDPKIVRALTKLCKNTIINLWEPYTKQN